MRPTRSAFTLVELLMVIVIIGLLAALLATALSGARIKAIDARMTAEINQLDAAIKSHREKYGAFPPDFNNTVRVTTHVRRMFPRFTGSPPTAFTNGSINEAEALVLWLGGMGWSGKKASGFHLNPTSPFSTAAGASQRTPPSFQFDQTRLYDEDNDGFFEFYPPQKSSQGDGVPPYVYFENYKWVTAVTAAPNHAITNAGMARPYLDSTSSGGTGFMNPDTFQIICAGQDDNYGSNTANGTPAAFTSGIANEHLDNLTNFTTGRLEDGPAK
jgi:prepilin-type N-terminal cleavage/methylation domain-containing protein